MAGNSGGVPDKENRCPALCNSPKCPINKTILIDTVKKPVVWILGGPGCGKGTQCHKIVAKYGFEHLSTGDILREEVKRGTEKSEELRITMEKGGLVATDIVLTLLKAEMMIRVDKAKGFLIDGYPREKSQGIAFEKAIGRATAILYFEVSAETLRQRLLGRAATSGRFDDNEESIKLRLKTFFSNNDEVINQYPDQIHMIDAEGTPDEVFSVVVPILDPIIERSK